MSSQLYSMPKRMKMVETRVSHLIAKFFLAVVQALDSAIQRIGIRETNCVIY